MDDHRFDELTRTLATNTSRRGLVKGLAGLAAGGVAGSLGWRRSEAATSHGCASDADCGDCHVCQIRSGRDGGHCVAGHEGGICGNECGTCQRGSCLASDSSCRPCEQCNRHTLTCQNRCPDGGYCCSDQCCSHPCNADDQCSCPNDKPPCGDTCCSDGQSCCNGQCCDTGCRDDGSCCPSDQFCGHVCCDDGETCCSDGTCKPPDQCCPDDKQCGQSCCGNDQVCCGDGCVAVCTNACDHNPTSCACDQAPSGLAYCAQTASCVDNTCPDGQYFNLDNCQCACADGSAICGDQCVPACTNGCTLSPTTCACDTPAPGTGYCPQTQGCVDNSCPDGQFFNQATCSCECPSGQKCGGNCCTGDTHCCDDGTCQTACTNCEAGFFVCHLDTSAVCCPTNTQCCPGNDLVNCGPDPFSGLCCQAGEDDCVDRCCGIGTVCQFSKVDGESVPTCCSPDVSPCNGGCCGPDENCMSCDGVHEKCVAPGQSYC